jgi:protein SCO1/2
MSPPAVLRTRRPIAPVTLVSGCLLVLAACGGGSAPSLTGQVITPNPVVSTVSLPEATSGTPFRFAAPAGHVLLVYFGYTSCPDICPTTLADVRDARAKLGADGAKVDLAMVTIDPDRDTAANLTAYVTTFVPTGQALRTTDAAALSAAAAAFGASYEVTTTPEGKVEVGHSAYLYGVDPSGRVRVVWPFGVTVKDLNADLRLLLANLDTAKESS